MVGTEQIYRERAEACRREAGRVANLKEREQWLALAAEWTRMADTLAQLRRVTEPRDPEIGF
jgi:hypothetical protein